MKAGNEVGVTELWEKKNRVLRRVVVDKESIALTWRGHPIAVISYIPIPPGVRAKWAHEHGSLRTQVDEILKGEA